LALVSFVLASIARTQDFEGYYIGGEHEHAAFRTQGSGWTNKSSGTSGLGRPATLTWSVVPDGTQLPTGLGEPASDNDLIAFLDGVHHGGATPGGSDLAQRSWWQLMNSAFERWDALTGISFSYEPNDDGLRLASANGVLGLRGDYRIGGHGIDGQTSPTFLAYNYFPNNADMVIDTDEINRWSNANDNYLLFRNMMMHEIGHGIGLNHVESFDVDPVKPQFQFGTFLMEPILASTFDGPQFDDILGAHRLYGDVNETGNGNETPLTATALGSLQTGQTISIGTDATDTFVGPTDVDFVSIDDNSDTDYFKFSITAPESLSLTLTPLGPTYDEGPQSSGNGGNQQPLVSAALNDLSMSIYDSNFSLLQQANNTGIGQLETINNLPLPTAGDYYVRISGVSNTAQFYQLDVFAVPEPTTACLAALGLLLCGARWHRE